MEIKFVINLVVAGFYAMGAHHASYGAVSNSLAWVQTHHWLIRICRVGSAGCHF